jgi:hypothetical protein
VTESADAVLTYWTEHRQQLRQSENQRAVLTNYILVMVTAVSGFIVQQNLKPATAALSILIVMACMVRSRSPSITNVRITNFMVLQSARLDQNAR